MGELAGKAVVITGAGRGIGAACARGIAAQGAAVVVNDIDRREAEEVVSMIVARGGRAIASVADITNWDQAGMLIASCIDEFGRIDGLVNNAGLFHLGLLTEFEPRAAQWSEPSTFTSISDRAAQAIGPMVAQGAGSIVNVTSGAHLGIAAMGVYGASKGAVASMTYTWAMELASTGVRVNALSPLAATRMTIDSANYAKSQGQDPSPFLQAQPPEANSPVVEYLLSDRSVGVTGQIIRIDRDELSLYNHPTIQMPPSKSGNAVWSLESVARTFDDDLRYRLAPCGMLGSISDVAMLDSGR
jgi:NAD(P)-dependent dehydrogenase (short-subunit alcohol dehydrogenase family)